MNIQNISVADIQTKWNLSLEKTSLFLEPHPKYPTHIAVSSFNLSYKDSLSSVLGDRSAVPIFGLGKLYSLAESEGFSNIFFIGDSQQIVDRFSALSDPYPYSLNFNLKDFQIQGFNYLKDSKSDIVNWSTGAGKTIFGIAKAKYLLESGRVDKIIVASRNHNRTNWKRQFLSVANLHAVVAEAKGDSRTQRKARGEIYTNNPIVIINYEKLRGTGSQGGLMGDLNEIVSAVKGKNLYIIWDEMPVMLKTPSSLTYKGARSVIKAPKKIYQSMLSATPLENSPEDVYSCVKLLDPSVFSTVTQFRKEYGLKYNVFNPYKIEIWDRLKLPELGMRISHMTHQADKYRDPTIAAQFPKETWHDVIIDMSEEDRKLSDFCLDYILKNGDPGDIFPQILIMQLLCDNPALIHKSNSDLALQLAQLKPFTDKNSTKLSKLKEMLETIEGKIVLFDMYNDLGSRMLYDYATSWGHKAVLYDGTDKAKQSAEDEFRNDPEVKLFISSDKGSDSINLEKGSSVINYNLPYKYTTLIQRVNRINRLTSNHSNIYYYNLLVANSIEDRKLDIISKKRGLQEAIFSGVIADQTDSLGDISKKDLLFMLTGK